VPTWKANGSDAYKKYTFQPEAKIRMTGEKLNYQCKPATWKQIT
jgi:hypothetical protein